jgi:alkyl hydroperoxide reductase subunit AhpC
VDSVVDHRRWQREILETRGQEVNYPLIADTDMAVSKLHGMLPANEDGDVATRTAVDNATVRNVFMIGPDKRVKLMSVYPMSTGRNFDEILRTLDSLQLTAAHKVVTPAHWVDGATVIIAPSVSDDEATDSFPDGWHAVTPYLRFVAQPTGL